MVYTQPNIDISAVLTETSTSPSAATPFESQPTVGPTLFGAWREAQTSEEGGLKLNVEHGVRVDVLDEIKDFRALWRFVFNKQGQASDAMAASTPTHTEWMGAIPWQPGENLLQAGDVIHWLAPRRVELGTLVMTDRRLFFVVTQNGLARIRFSLPANQVRRNEDLSDADGQLVFSGGDDTWVFTPEAGRRSIRAFWSLLELRGEERPDNTLYKNQSITGVIGEAPFLRIKSNGEEVAHMEQVQIFATDAWVSHLAFLYPSVPDKALSIGNTVQLEVGHWDGVYLFDAEISDVTRAPEAFAHKVGQGRFVVKFRRPRDISRYNRRNAFRVVFDEARPTTFFVLDDHAEVGVPLERYDGELVDVSTTGCAIRTYAKLHVGEVLRLQVTLFDGTEKTVEAEIRNSVPPSEEGQRWRYGCLFHGLSKEEKHAMLDEVMLSQRDLLRLITDRRVEF